MFKMRRLIVFTLVTIAAFLRTRQAKQDIFYKLILTDRLSSLRDLFGRWKAWYCFEKARKDCPAYAQFIEENPGEVTLVGWTPDFSQVPATDKPNYVKRYPMADRCHGGKLPLKGVIDTSSGSTGKATPWPRGNPEREAAARTLLVGLRQLIPTKPILFINAFALGPWATGMCVSNAVTEECLLISVGPDIDKITEVLSYFRPDQFVYVIAGYPPFLKMLVDSKVIDKKFEAIAFYGGEGMSEAMRDYLLASFTAVYGDYGASDLEINIAAESDFTIALRKLMASNENLRHSVNTKIASLTGLERLVDALPHVFQYNSLDFFIESNSNGELLITACRESNAAPKIRYNIHDNGFVMTYGELLELLQEQNIDVRDFPRVLANLPLMFLYGRSDLSLSYYGCKIPPAAIEKILFEITELASVFNSFRLITQEDKNHNKRLTLAIELSQGQEPPSNVEKFKEKIFTALGHDSQDYREAARIAAQRGITPTLSFYRFREGPFTGADIRLKAKYTQES